MTFNFLVDKFHMYREFYPRIDLPGVLERYEVARWFHYEFSDLFPFALFAIGFLLVIQQDREEDMKEFGVYLKTYGFFVILSGILWLFFGAYTPIVLVVLGTLIAIVY